MRIWNGLLIAGAMLALNLTSCTPVHSNRPLGSEPARFTEEERLDGLWTDESWFYFIHTEDPSQGVLRITRVYAEDSDVSTDTFSVLVRQFDRNGERWLIFNEEDAELSGRYAWALGSRRGAEQVLIWFSSGHSKEFAHLLETDVLPGTVFDEPQSGESRFGGPTEVRVLLENVSDQDLGLIVDRRAELFGADPLVFTRLRRLP